MNDLSLNKWINKKKLNFFSSLAAIRLAHFVRYGLGILLGWLLWRSEVFFERRSFLGVIKSLLIWNNNRAAVLNDIFFTFVFFVFLLVLYFYFSGKLIQSLARINISANQFHDILKNKTYHLEEKQKYSITNVDDLEANIFPNSSCLIFRGSLIFEKQGKIGKINFICRSHQQNLQEYLAANNFKDYFPKSNINFRSRNFLGWQEYFLIILGLGSLYSMYRINSKALQSSEWTIKEVMAGNREKMRQEEARRKKEAEARTEKVRKFNITDPKEIDITFDDIGGYAEAKLEMRTIAQRIKKASSNGKKNIRPRHAILYGPPGTGKTMLAKATAKEAGALFLYKNGEDFKDSSGSTSKEKLIDFFNVAAQEAINSETPILIIIDEIDKMSDDGTRSGKSFRHMAQGTGGTQLLGILDGVKSIENVTLIATTNYLANLNPALLRSGRIGRKIRVSYPTMVELRDIVRKQLINFCKENAYLLGMNEQKFISEFTEIIVNKMEELKNILPYSRSLDKNKSIFVGADVAEIIFGTVPDIMMRKNEKKVSRATFERAVERVFEDNRSGGLLQEDIINDETESIMRGEKEFPKREKSEGPHF